MIKIDQWCGAKGIIINQGAYSFSIFPSILARYRTREYFKQQNYLQELFSIKRNLRLALCDWTLDVKILGITLQFQKYNELMRGVK